MGVLVGVGVAAFLAVKGHEHQPPGIKTGEARRHDQRPKGHAALRACPSALNDRVFGQEPGKSIGRKRNADTGDRQRPDHHRPERVGDLFAQRPVKAHVLFVVHGMDHRPGTQKQHRLEERMRQQVEHGDRIDADTGGHEHVAQLRTGRIGDHPLDVVLHQPHSGREKRRQRAEEHDHLLGLGRVFKQRRHAADQKYARRHHGRGVDQGADRCRALHRVGQPGVQKELRRFSHGTDEQQHRDQVGRPPVAPEEGDGLLAQIGRCGEDIIQFDRIDQKEQPEYTQCKAEIADPVDDERLDRGGIGRGLAIVKPDQQVRGDANAFPPEKHLHKVVRGDQRQHGESEERQERKETRLIDLALVPLRVVVHIAEAVEVNHRRDRRHHDQHDRRQPVQPDRPVGGKAARFDPAQNLNVLGFAVEVQENDPAQATGQKEHARGHPHRRRLADDPPAKAADDGTDQGPEQDDDFHELSPSSR